MLSQRLDRNQWLEILRASPVGKQLAMVERRPLHHQTDGSWMQRALQEAWGIDGNHDLLPTVEGVKMRWGMVIEVHLDDDAEEAGDLWHLWRLAGDTSLALLVRFVRSTPDVQWLAMSRTLQPTTASPASMPIGQGFVTPWPRPRQPVPRREATHCPDTRSASHSTGECDQ